ncbi:putative DNA helicase, nucleic acid-binding, P-loop containing nucleoside triphosphate hydrolase [Helianthus annuus]|nr:putative DNA helicase, nucleic acid-binding, P-loop containing nucleoside triphosphate hydrolase [Helianthus annuus]
MSYENPCTKKDCSSAAPLPSMYVVNYYFGPSNYIISIFIIQHVLFTNVYVCLFFCLKRIPPSEITFLKDLHPSRLDFTIKIRVLRARNRMSFKNENEIYALEMLVVDEEGTRRQMTCLKTLLTKFGPLLQEGSTVIIKKPTLGDNLSSFKYVDCPHKICLYYDSKVIKCNDFLGYDNGFSFTPFSSILDKTSQNTQPIDVIGDVCVCYDTESFTGKNGKKSVKRTMQLEDKEFVGVPIMLLRNINLKNGLCNGTRLRVLYLGDKVIEAEIISGANIGTRTFIRRLSLSPSKKKIPFKFKRRQFLVAVSFAMTINKSQGQSLSKVGLYLKDPVFSHGQLYAALSRVKSRADLKMPVIDKDGHATNKTTNVVYEEIFGNL